MIDYLDIVILFIKAALILGAVMNLALLVIWVERKGSALIQNRIGANRAAIFGFDFAGLVNTLVADPIKALTKEDFVPAGTSQFMHSLAPFLAVFPVILSFAVIPFGPPLQIAGREIPLQLASLNAGLLIMFAFLSLAVYGTVLAGWVSQSKFALLGSLRAAAQMISYEIVMGISIVGLLAAYGSLDLARIVEQQSGTIWGILPCWGIFMTPFNFIAFLLFFVSAMAETKRAPFDLPESESELVAGYFTEYSGMKFLLFWLGEFAEIVVASAMVVVLFFGGWQAPYINLSLYSWGPLIGVLVFGLKVSFFCVLQVIIRWSLPRFRYDQLLGLCWKRMLPLALVNLVAAVVWELWW